MCTHFHILSKTGALSLKLTGFCLFQWRCMKGPTDGITHMGPGGPGVRKHWWQQHGLAVPCLTLSRTRQKQVAMKWCCSMSWFFLLLLLRGLLLTSSTRNQEEPMYGVEQRRKKEDGSAWSYFWAEELPSWPPALSAQGPPWLCLCGNIHEFHVPQNEPLHTALHTDFAKEKHSPVNITRTQLSNFYVWWERREMIQYILLLFLPVLTSLLMFRHY